MQEDDDFEVTKRADRLSASQTKWVKDNLVPGGQDFSIVMAVGRNGLPSIWVHRSDGTGQDDRPIKNPSPPREIELQRGTGSECVVYKIGGKRVVVCW